MCKYIIYIYYFFPQVHSKLLVIMYPIPPPQLCLEEWCAHCGSPDSPTSFTDNC